MSTVHSTADTDPRQQVIEARVVEAATEVIGDHQQIDGASTLAQLSSDSMVAMQLLTALQDQGYEFEEFLVLEDAEAVTLADVARSILQVSRIQ